MHNDPFGPMLLSSRRATAMAGQKAFSTITIKGTGSHAAPRPVESTRIVIGSALVQTVQSIASPQYLPTKPIVSVVIQVQCGLCL